MGNKTRGLFNGRMLLKRRERVRFSKNKSKSYFSGHWKKFDPLGGAPQAKGIVLEKVEITPKKPSSGKRKSCKVQLTKNGKVITAYIPFSKGISFIDEHNDVMIERIGGAQKGARGDLPGVKFKITMVNGISLKELVKGRKQKPMR
jgi:small subunit ribosomal protein S12